MAGSEKNVALVTVLPQAIKDEKDVRDAKDAKDGKDAKGQKGQNGKDQKDNDGVYNSKTLRCILRFSDVYGACMQIQSHGFLNNRRQWRQFGLAVVSMAQEIRHWWARLEGSEDTEGSAGSAGSAGSEGSEGSLHNQVHQDSARANRDEGSDGSQDTQGSQDIQGSQDTHGTHGSNDSNDRAGSEGKHGTSSTSIPTVPALLPDNARSSPSNAPMSYRDILDIAVQWRQVSEPNDPVWWIDLLTEASFQEGGWSMWLVQCGRCGRETTH